MSDQDLIRRGDALEATSKAVRRDPMPTVGRILDAIAALPAVTSDREARLAALLDRAVNGPWLASDLDDARALLAELETK
jgi:hypothetical protein